MSNSNVNKNDLSLVILFTITAVYYFPIINLPLAPYDEAAILVGADRILNGEIPHTDFSSEYPAGQLYVLAALFKLFGTSVITERVYDLVIRTCISLFIFLNIRLLCSNKAALFGWLMSLIWLQHSSFPAYPVYPSILFIFIGGYFVLLHIIQQKIHFVFFSAISIVIAVLFRHDLGGYAVIITAFVLYLRRFTEAQSWKPFISFVVGGLIAALPVLLFFYIYADVGFMWNDLFIIPMAFLDYQAIPYPSLSRWNLPFYVFPMIVVAGTIASVMMIKRKKDHATTFGILLFCLLGVSFLNQVRIRSDTTHLLPTALTGIMMAPVLINILTRNLSVNSWLYRAVILVMIVVFGITLSRPVEVIKRLLSITNGYVVKNITPDVERAKYLHLSIDLRNSVAYIKNNTAKNEKIYVGVKNHDQFVFNDVILYFLAERNAATKYHTLNPGVHTTLRVQEEVVNELRENAPQLIVLVPRARYEPNLSNVDTQVDLLDKYIEANYILKKTFGIYEIWIKAR